ncbi:uncharacterized protein TNCV_1296271 [Trichonephila clavipes]|uniref:Uncharacterized protein n=1 Tax=Trichonephila clavipes TaxID=2585209 RepID=A0A8X6SKP5_TRICX|nr:uncharacterized protein TNCV_1296271 [Trichonephila clavipes]
MLRRHFGDGKIISWQFSTAWPPRYPDLNHCEFRPLAYLKAMVYRDLITSPSDLKESTERHVRKIPLFMLLSTIELAILRFHMVAGNWGQHIEHVL